MNQETQMTEERALQMINSGDAELSFLAIKTLIAEKRPEVEVVKIIMKSTDMNEITKYIDLQNWEMYQDPELLPEFKKLYEDDLNVEEKKE